MTAGDAVVVFTEHPAEFAMRLTVSRCDKMYFDMQAAQVEDIRVLNERNREVLEILISDRARLRFSLYPLLEIKQI